MYIWMQQTGDKRALGRSWTGPKLGERLRTSWYIAAYYCSRRKARESSRFVGPAKQRVVNFGNTLKIYLDTHLLDCTLSRVRTMSAVP